MTEVAFGRMRVVKREVLEEGGEDSLAASLAAYSTRLQFHLPGLLWRVPQGLDLNSNQP